MDLTRILAAVFAAVVLTTFIGWMILEIGWILLICFAAAILVVLAIFAAMYALEG